jgi:hypothetical protein
MDKLGHVQGRFYGDLAVEFVNCLLHGLRKFDRTYACAYRICPAIPAAFTDSTGYIDDPSYPADAHYHEGDDTVCPGEFHVDGWGGVDGKLEIIWTDHEGLTRVVYGETYTTPLYLT